MIGIGTDVGNRRQINEDYAGYVTCSDFCLYVVADGMGGHNAGEVASRLAVEGVITYVRKNYGIIEETCLLANAIKETNLQLFKYSLGNEGLSGMGTTLTACLITNNITQVAHIGDSCCFGLKDKEIIKITKDHSLVQELLDCGSISEDEALNHPRKNVITRAVGTSINVEADIYNIEKGTYNIYVICSDGLTNEVSKEEIRDIVLSKSNFEEACSVLVDLANDRGGKDNITVMIFGGEI